MDEMQFRFLTAQALYGKHLEERSSAIRQLRQSDLNASEVEALGVRLELALGCQDEYVRSAAAMLLDGLAQHIPVSPAMSAALLDLSQSSEAFARESALRAIKRVWEEGHCVSAGDTQALHKRLEEARRSEEEGFILSLFDEKEEGSHAQGQGRGEGEGTPTGHP